MKKKSFVRLPWRVPWITKLIRLVFPRINPDWLKLPRATRACIFPLVVGCFAIWLPLNSFAQEPELLFDLIGGDLTDPDDDEDPESDDGYDAVDSDITFTSAANATYAIETSSEFEEWIEVVDGFESGGELTNYSLELEEPVPSDLYIRVRQE